LENFINYKFTVGTELSTTEEMEYQMDLNGSELHHTIDISEHANGVYLR